MSLMWSTAGVEIPEELSIAFEADKVVFFCGAGISMGTPADLPDFLQLTAEIVNEVGRSQVFDDHTQLDVVLGNMDRLGGRVHLRAASKIEESDKPNTLHRLIVRMAARRTVRVVTTNFDQHLEKAALSAGIETAVFAAPALPLGDEFEGIVHVHGRVPIAPNETMVLTDTDFGDAYIVRGWATEFLTAMFQNYTIVFVGYSAKDTVMRYLTRAIAGESRIYALIPDTETIESWKDIDVLPLVYPNSLGDYSGAVELFENWNQRADLGAVERLNFVRDLALNPGDVKTRLDQLVWVLGDPELLGHFVSYAGPEDWLRILEHESLVNNLFEAETDSENDDRIWLLAAWVASSITSHGGDLLVQVLAEHRGRLSGALWFHVWRRLENKYVPSIQFRRLSAMLLSAPDIGEADRKAALLKAIALKDPEFAEITLQQFLREKRSATTTRSWLPGGTGSPEFRYDFQSDSETWEQLASSVNDPRDLLAVALSALARIEIDQALLSGSESAGWVSWQRNAIATDDYTDDSVGRVVSLSRALFRSHLQKFGPELSFSLTAHRSSIVRRLALDSLLFADAKHAGDIVTLLLEGEFIFEIWTKPEVFALLKKFYGATPYRLQKRLVDHVVGVAAALGEKEVRPYERYNLLSWLIATAPDNEPAGEAFVAYASKNPTFGPREHPDLNSWSSEMALEPKYQPTGRYAKMDAVRVARALKRETDVSDAGDSERPIAELRMRIGKDGDFALTLMQECVAIKLWNRAVWRLLIESGPKEHTDKWLPIAVHCVESNPEREHLASSLHQMLRPKREPIRTLRLRLAMSFTLWESMPSGDQKDAEESMAANARSIIAESIMAAIGAIVAKQTKHLLHPGDAQFLTNVLDAELKGQSVAAIGRATAFLAQVNPGWFDAVVLPRFDPEHPSSARLWQGFIQGMAWNASIHSRLFETLRTMLPWIRMWNPKIVRDFISLHAGVFVQWGAATGPVWADPFHIEAEQHERIAWLRAVGRAAEVGDVSTNFAFLNEYWKRRLTGLPAAVSSQDQAALLGWLHRKNSSFAPMAERFSSGPPVASIHGHLFVDLTEWPLALHPLPAARAMLRLVTSSMTLPGFSPQIADHAEQVAKVDPDLAVTLLSELVRRRYEGASQRLEAIRLEGTN